MKRKFVPPAAAAALIFSILLSEILLSVIVISAVVKIIIIALSIAASSSIIFLIFRKFHINIQETITLLSSKLENAEINEDAIGQDDFISIPVVKQLVENINTLTDKYKKNLHKIEDNMQIGHALAIEKNHYRLFHTILYYSKKLTGADAGSIFIVETDGENKILRFKYTHTFSKNLPYEEFTMPLDKNSIAGYVAVTGEILNIPDAYHIEESMPYSFNKKFDKTNHYRTKSMLVVPMSDHSSNIIGVIQLINCKHYEGAFSGNEAYEIILSDDQDMDKYVASFSREDENLTLSIAGEAAIALDNIRMINQIKNQFDSFVKASVTAIESRDPATSGHSFRVAEMSLLIADNISECNNEAFSNTFFSSEQMKGLEYAAMVHDFGKIYIDPGIFLKGKKLFEKDYEFLRLRLSLIRVILKNNYLEESSKAESELAGVLEDEYNSRIESLELILELLTRLNDPTADVDDLDSTIDSIVQMSESLKCSGPDGKSLPLLTEQEIINLRIKRGSLNPVERKIIESHVNYSYSFVSQIPWPAEYENIPDIVLCHHELLDGSGYPHGKKGSSTIPIEARIMTIADIYDALIAADRPYKKAMPLKTVLKILKDEADDGRLDKNIVDLFIEKKIYLQASS